MQTLNYSAKFQSAKVKVTSLNLRKESREDEGWKWKQLTNVYSWPQYIFVSSGKDMIFLREDNICNMDKIMNNWG